MTDTPRRLSALEEVARRQTAILERHADRLARLEDAFRVRRAQESSETADARAAAVRERQRQARLDAGRRTW